MTKDADWFDKGYDRVSQFFEKIIDNDFARQWFLWIEWVTLTAALWAIAEKSNSLIVRIVAIFSAIIVFFRAWISVERFVIKILPKAKELSKGIIWGGSLLVALIPFVLIHFLAEIFKSILE